MLAEVDSEMLPAILAFLCGMVLGQRFKVFVLAPAILLVLVLILGVGIARAETAWTIGLNTVALITSLQIGYLLGLAIRQLLLFARAKRFRAAFANSLPARRSAR